MDRTLLVLIAAISILGTRSEASEPWLPEFVESATLVKFVGGTDSYVQPHDGMALHGFEKGNLRLRGGATLPTAFLEAPTGPAVQHSDDVLTIRYTLDADSHHFPRPNVSIRGLPATRYVCGFDLPPESPDATKEPDQRTTIALVTRGAMPRSGRMTIAHRSNEDGGLVYVAVFRCRLAPNKVPKAVK